MTRTNFNGRENLQVTIQPNIGLDAVVRQSVVEMLNLHLADEAVLLLMTRRAEWHAGEANVPDLQSVYETQYQQMHAISEAIKERIQILGGFPRNNAQELINSARLDGARNAVPGNVSLLADHEAFIRFLREDALKCSEIYEDQGTFALLVSMLRTHEKIAWLLRSKIDLKPFGKEK